MSAVADLLRAILAFLRYLAAPLVAVFVVGLCDEHHDIFSVVKRDLLATVSESDVHWIAGAALITLGLVSYYLHRLLIHRYLSEWIVKKAATKRDVKPDVHELKFARWERRAEGHLGRSARAALDEMNTPVHFFYSSAVASLLLAGVLWNQLSPGSFPRIVALALLLFGLACCGDYQAAGYDADAYKRYPHGRFKRRAAPRNTPGRVALGIQTRLRPTGSVS